ncbi:MULTISPECIES: DUF1360 domain-containing protein [Neobacillus]|uniref:DUF1360 domain-containing protein n=1 Tax=Neobacillus rhizophilus TaxID=2833579 RepID=A0A942U081_9BACI|nr:MULTISPECIES: DUF1360 domain-containing protein [Neobacillus]MBS4212121.1 DUF1360 domain-containing protein [Neobacillus rhizophilus]MBU8915551.1 DUF1360 domain-containing protein [Bacillus sp. FJAT-29953]
MKINLINLLLLALASFRFTRLIVFDKITEFLRNPFFDEVEEVNPEGEVELYYIPKKSGIRRFIGELLSCYWCTGIWSSAIIVGISYLSPRWAEPMILILAVAGIAAMVETVIQYLIEK